MYGTLTFLVKSAPSVKKKTNNNLLADYLLALVSICMDTEITWNQCWKTSIKSMHWAYVKKLHCYLTTLARTDATVTYLPKQHKRKMRPILLLQTNKINYIFHIKPTLQNFIFYASTISHSICVFKNYKHYFTALK